MGAQTLNPTQRQVNLFDVEASLVYLVNPGKLELLGNPVSKTKKQMC